jgi:hypothetical protein
MARLPGPAARGHACARRRFRRERRGHRAHRRSTHLRPRTDRRASRLPAPHARPERRQTRRLSVLDLPVRAGQCCSWSPSAWAPISPPTPRAPPARRRTSDSSRSSIHTTSFCRTGGSRLRLPARGLRPGKDQRDQRLFRVTVVVEFLLPAAASHAAPAIPSSPRVRCPLSADKA